MTSLRQFEANRRNALKSTGPKSENGKQRSRRNAVRHGLTAETVIDVLEDPEDYKAFEAAITADYDAQSAVERELILRLASLLWRLRRATTIETGLLQIQGEILRDFRHRRQVQPQSADRVLKRFFHRGNPISRAKDDGAWRDFGSDRKAGQRYNGEGVLESSQQEALDIRLEVARCFLRLANLDSGVFERLSRYEAALWRQVGQTLFALEALRRRSPTERM